MPWATATEVAEITGVTVTDAQLKAAQSVIELRIGRTETSPGGLPSSWIHPRDLRWLKRAVAYQAAWMPAQPDYLTRSQTDGTVIQDGAHVNVTKAGQYLAPLAIVALKKLSWRGTRSIHTESTLSGTRGPYHLGVDGVVSVFDYQNEPWQPLE